MTKFIQFLVGLFSGGLFGAGLALLFAPASGNELRNQFYNRTHSLQDEIRSAAAQRRVELQAQLEALRTGRG